MRPNDRGGDERSRYGIAIRLEHRPDRNYDETTPSTILPHNGPPITSNHRGFVCAALRHLYGKKEV